MIFDLAIIGGGPGGSAAGIYAARKKLKTIIITETFGGQSIVSAEIQNWIGSKSISGEDLARQIKEHLYAYEGEDLKIKVGRKVTGIAKLDKHFIVTDNAGETFESRAVLIATGASHRRLDVTGAKEFDQKGITYCATCDGPLFSGKDVVVIGGGNAAFESAGQLLAYCKSVTMIHRSDKFRADAITVERIKKQPNFKLISGAEVLEFKGTPSTSSGQANFIKSLVYKDLKTGESKELPTDGVFVEIGLVPITGFAKDLVKLNEYNQIVVDPRTQQTSVPGVWAAGDCTDGLYHQNNIAAGDAIKALEDIYNYLNLQA